MLMLSSHWNGVSAAAFLCLIVFLAQGSSASADAQIESLCPPQQPLVPVFLDKIIDGDTVILTDGRHVRMIGINTPEMNQAKRNQDSRIRSTEPEPYAMEARRSLGRWIKRSKQIYMAPGSETKDRYGRTLAHLYSEPFSEVERRNSGIRYNIAAQLIRRGLGFHIAIPPNLRHSVCLKQAESQARVEGLGLWRGYTAVRPEQDRPLKTGFQLVSGRVAEVTRAKSGWWLALDGPLALRIKPNNIEYFDLASLHSLEGERVTIRGWVIDRGRQFDHHPKGYKRWVMNLTHPLMIGKI